MRHGKTPQGKQRDRCRQCSDQGRTLLLDYSYPGPSPYIKAQIGDMAMHASGIRETACVLHVSPTTVIKERKKTPDLPQVNQGLEVLTTAFTAAFFCRGHLESARWMLKQHDYIPQMLSKSRFRRRLHRLNSLLMLLFKLLARIFHKQ